MTQSQKAARAFAARITSLGFVVYLTERGDGGFITDSAGSRVLCFGSNGQLSGTYGPPSTRSGTGWVMDQESWNLKSAEDVRAALYAMPPKWCDRDRDPRPGAPTGGWRYLSTVAQFLALYGSTSRYSLFTPEG